MPEIIKANQAEAPDPGRYMRISQLTQYISLGRTTIYRLAREGKFPKPIKLTENTTVWDVNEVDAWVEARRNAQGGAA
ncbi:AlpA family phage regulatory protein [Candidatus Parcubacteria bacterium]|nr:MAG: AlpA family phage regulatory protein [Candidatus Parcubacteria bacterium]